MDVALVGAVVIICVLFFAWAFSGGGAGGASGGKSCAVIVLAFLLLVVLLLVAGVVVGAAAPLDGTGEGYCYGVSYPVTVTIVAPVNRGFYWLTVETDGGDVYSLPTTRLFRVGQSRTLQGLYCDGLGFSASRVK